MPRFFRFAARVGLLSVFLAFAPCYAATGITDVTLSNGLKVVVQEDQRAPVVVTQIWYKVGASDEPEGLTGISHVLEHMMFKGTPAHPAGEFSRIIAENGGRENAFTGPDYTAYFQQLEKSRLGIAFELEADRMQNLILDEKEFSKEIRVVMEERRLRTDDQPEALAYERFMHTAYAVHNYRNPVIGWMRDLEKLSIRDLHAWYRRWYVPNNATLVVVGDVKASEVIALAERTFGKIPRRTLERTVVPVEPAQAEQRRSRIKAPAQVPTLFMGYHVPVLSMRPDDWEPYALMLLSGLLDGGGSSRFERQLVRGQEIAAGIGTGYSPVARHPGLFTISATPSEKKTVTQLEAAIREEIRRLQEEPIGADELARVKAQVTARDVFARDSMFYQAMQMGTLETVGLDAHLLGRNLDRLRAVTAVQVQQVARKYLKEPNLTVTVLDPEPGKMKPRAPRATGDSHVR